MSDLLKYLIFKPVATVTAMGTVIPLPATPDVSSSSLLTVYPGNSDSVASSPTTYDSRSASPSEAASSPATSLNSSTCEDVEMFEEEQEVAEYYDPEYATYLVANMMTEEDMRQRKENEEIYRIQNVLEAKREWDGRLKKRMGEKMLSNEIDRHLRGGETRKRIEEGVKMERDVGRNAMFTMGKGTGGVEGHRRLQAYFDSTLKKRKRGVEDDGDEDKGVERKKRKVISLKTYLQKKKGDVAR
jgi:hypothetical protein